MHWRVFFQFNHSEDKRNDGTTSPWVFFKFFFVVSMFSKCPNGHLIGSCKGKNSSWKALSHNAKSNPCTNLIGVVRARDYVKKTSKWVSSGEGNLTHFGTCKKMMNFSKIQRQCWSAFSQYFGRQNSCASINLQINFYIKDVL